MINYLFKNKPNKSNNKPGIEFRYLPYFLNKKLLINCMNVPLKIYLTKPQQHVPHSILTPLQKDNLSDVKM